MPETDAKQIVQAWGRYGSDGLGELDGQDEDEAVRRLLEAAKKEGELKEGAFFGAMLTVRIGAALRNHVATLLYRLREREVGHGVTLLDAFAYIAAMHVERLPFLSRTVLAQALGCDRRKLKPIVLGPLGKEAAAVGAGQALVTRHRAIARAAVEVLSDVLQWDIDEIYADLAFAASLARKEQGYLPDVIPKNWYFDLPSHFIRAGRVDLGIGIARRVLDADPDNMRLRDNLSKLYRKEAKAPQEAVKLFREYTGTIRDRLALRPGPPRPCVRNSANSSVQQSRNLRPISAFPRSARPLSVYDRTVWSSRTPRSYRLHAG